MAFDMGIGPCGSTAGALQGEFLAAIALAPALRIGMRLEHFENAESDRLARWIR
jgi:hypothetical protein